MPNANDPFELDDGFENIPVVQAPAQAVNKVASSTVKHTAAQAKAIANAFVKQLYGSSSASATDDDQQQADATVDPMAQAQKTQATGHAGAQAHGTAHAGVQAKSSTTQQKASTPEEEEQLAKARRELAQTHRQDYYIPTLGDITNLESDIRKEAEKRKQAEQQRDQQEEQEKQQLADIEEQKKKEPIAVTRGRNKAEANRGASG
jgi:hypothetical protein